MPSGPTCFYCEELALVVRAMCDRHDRTANTAMGPLPQVP